MIVLHYTFLMNLVIYDFYSHFLLSVPDFGSFGFGFALVANCFC